MKMVASFIFSFLFIGSLFAQSTTSLSVPTEQQFVPKYIQFDQSASIPTYLHFSKTNKLLESTGWLLHGLKFESVIDEFSALSPFDYRDFEPTTFTEFNYYFTTNYLLIDY